MGEALEECELMGYTGVLRGDVTVLGLSPTWNGKIQDNGYPSSKEEEKEQGREEDKEEENRKQWGGGPEEMGRLLAALAAKDSGQAPPSTVGIVLPLTVTLDIYGAMVWSLYHNSPKTLCGPSKLSP